MNETQKKLLDLLKRFDGLCQKFGIEYYLGGGSALGAIRHQGFLPWDDDVDLYITQSNYNKLINVKQDFFDDDFILVNHEDYPKYGNTLVRCVETNSTAITKARMVDGTPKGQFLELFILDPMPMEDEVRKNWLKKHWIYTELMAIAFKVTNPRVDYLVDEQLWEKYQKRVSEKKLDIVLKELENELFSYDEDLTESYCLRWGLRTIVYDKKWFNKARYVSFEDTYLPVAQEAEKVLRKDYGDTWMNIPSSENQITHNFAASNEIPYSYFEQDYSRFLDQDSVFLSYRPRKKALMEEYFCFRKKQKLCQDYHEIHVLSSIKYKIRLIGDPLDLLKKAEFSKLREIFLEWENVQFSRHFITWHRVINLPESLLSCALVVQLMIGEYGRVINILDLAKEQQLYSSELDPYYDFALAVRNAYVALDTKDDLKLKESLKRAENTHFSFRSQQYDYCYLKIIESITSSNSDNQLNRIFANAKKLLCKYPDRGELYSLIGDIEYRLAMYAESGESYIKALELTRNAFIIQHCKKALKDLGKLSTCEQ